MTQEKQTRRQMWYRFGEPVSCFAVSIPETLKAVIQEEARDRGVSASSLVTDILMRRWRKKVREHGKQG
jgi:hypothetical protein